MKKFYTLLLSIFMVSVGSAQIKTFVADKAWVNEAEEWSDFQYAGKIVFSFNPNDEAGSVRIGNYDFLYDFVEGRGKLAKASYSSAAFSHPKKIASNTDKQGILNSTYEGTLIFQAGTDYYSVIAVVTILEKDDNVLGVQMRLKENKRKEFAFSTKPNS
ncbi:hypothetical protein ACFFLS_16260 [Flavobacterium procerum]|uniref:DUF4251 domain-containing protein n=1 Tax=Flavobacterium procerum TaxID=1455569 RepID=A0ABV6BT51_9FLAO